MKLDWPKAPTSWIEGRTLKVSIPFTWNLPALRNEFRQGSILYDNIIVGGPALGLMPEFFAELPHVAIGTNEPGVLARINPQATRTTIGCTRKCKFCAVGTGKVEPVFEELADWPNLPIFMDNNLFAASKAHVERVMGRLAVLGEADFNQGLDVRYLTEDYARMIAEIKEPVVRLALDNMRQADEWQAAFDRLRTVGIAKRKIKSYCLVGFDSDPAEAWERCQWIEAHGVQVAPMWFHTLDALQNNVVTEDQVALGWTDYERRKIMQWFYQHKHAVKGE